MKAVILNTDSILNPGDAGIVLAQIEILRKIFPGAGLSITSRTAGLDRRFYGPLGVSVLEPFLPAPSVWRGFGRKIVRSAAGLLNPGPKMRLLESIRNSNFVVSTGGGPFYSNRRTAPGLTFYQNILNVRLAQALGKPVVFFPQSFGPFLSSPARRAVLRLLGHRWTVRIFVRESSSGDQIGGFVPDSVRKKIEICPDMTLWLRPGDREADDPALAGLPRPLLLLTVRDWDFPEAGMLEEREALKRRYLRAVADAACRFVSRTGGSLAVVPHTRGPGDFEDDRIVSGRLWASLKDALPRTRSRLVVFPGYTPPTRFLGLYASADLVLATRTHSAVFALLSGTPAVSIHYQPKGSGIMGMLGLGEYSFPISGLNPDSLAEAMDSVLNRRTEIRPRLAERFASLRSEIESKIRSSLKDFA